MSDVTAKVISQKGTCEAGHKVGDKFVIGQQTTPKLSYNDKHRTIHQRHKPTLNIIYQNQPLGFV